MLLRTFIHGLVSGTKSSDLKASTSTGFESSSSESGNPYESPFTRIEMTKEHLNEIMASFARN